MGGSASASFLPFFLDSAGRRLFAFASRPSGGSPRHGILVCPPFAEEMNRARRTVRLLCAQAAERGMAAIQVDLHGTGDSGGDFADARWTHWLEDLASGARWLNDAGARTITVVGIRAGALLAWELARAHAPAHVVLWQPVLTGKSVVTDLLRARIAAGAATGRRESLGELRGELDAGRDVEAAGYRLAPALAAALDGAAILPPDAPAPPSCWIEVAGDPALAVRQPVADLVANLQAAGAPVDLRRAADPPFWSTTEITVGRAIVGETLQWLGTRA